MALDQQIYVYEVPGISCGHCKNAIEGEVSKVAGVRRVDVSIEDKIVTVEGTAADADLRAAIDEAGYEVAGVR
ncbi:MAG TPA: cation transporter [Acidimicrobiales bacterium]